MSYLRSLKQVFLKTGINPKLIVILLLGFASGLPLALTGQSLQAWLTVENVDIATIGFFSLVGIPYTFKFLWAPLMDRFEIPFLGRRRGWLVLTQAFLALALFLISLFSPSSQTQSLALVAVLVAFLSASQDVVIDAYRTDILQPQERGLGSSLFVFGYRLAMVLSGGIAFVWADPLSGSGLNWPKIYVIMACLMLAASMISLFFLPKLSEIVDQKKSAAKNDIIGFLSLVFVVFIGYQITTKLFGPMVENILIDEQKKWADILKLFLGLGFTLPLAWWVSQKARFETLNTSLQSYLSSDGALAFLALIILYKLGDAFAGSLLTPFLIKGVGYSQAEIGVVNKVIGLWLTIIGAITGGALMMRLGLYRSLFLFGFLQMLSNIGFWFIAVSGQGLWGSITLPAFDFYIVALKEATQIDWLLLLAIALENLTGGMGSAAFVALLMSLCNQRFTATHYALLSAFSVVGRVWVGPVAGVLTESLGWPLFFILSTILALPGLYMVYRLRYTITLLETPPITK